MKQLISPLVGLLSLMTLCVGAQEEMNLARQDEVAMGSWREMPLFPAEIPGQPGAKEGERGAWAKPELVNYPGSIEHFRRGLKPNYLYPVNPYNHRTLVENFLAAKLPGVVVESFAEPVQYIPKGGVNPPIRTGEVRPPVPVVRVKPGGQRLTMKTRQLAPGTYVIRVIAALETKSVVDVGIPNDLVLDLEVNDGPGGEVGHYVLRQRGTDNFYGLGEFMIRLHEPRELSFSVGLHPHSGVDLLVHNVDVHDLLAELPKKAGKVSSLVLPLTVLSENWGVDAVSFMKGVKEGDWSQWFEFNQARHKMHQASQEEALKPFAAAHYRNESRIKAWREASANEDAGVAEVLREVRLAEDARLFSLLPPSNVNFIGYGLSGYTPDSTLPKGMQERLAAQGVTLTEPPGQYLKTVGPWKVNDQQSRLELTAEGAEPQFYTFKEMAALLPLPGVPIAVHPWGDSYVDGESRHIFMPLPRLAGNSLNRFNQAAQRSLKHFQGSGDLWEAHEKAVILCLAAYDFPTRTPVHSLYQQMGRQIQHREPHYQFIRWEVLATAYDQVFSYVEGNQFLADSVGRFIPGIKTPEDVVRLLDTGLLQFAAREMAYFQYYYDHQHSALLAKLVAVQQDPKLTEPWVWIIFNRTWEYPLAIGGLEDFVYTAVQQDGTTTIGSYSYTHRGNPFTNVALDLREFFRQGGDPKYDILNQAHYPRLWDAPYFFHQARIAGYFAPGIGDVGGPTSPWNHWMDQLSSSSLEGWRSGKDPIFAYLLTHYGELPASQSESEEIKAAAATLKRDPFFAKRSRVLNDWGGFLEGGTPADDFRLRHGVRLRVGGGVGHAHDDQLDLGLWTFGLIISGDGGARGGYGFPASSHAWMHNLATVGHKGLGSQSAVTDLADMEGSQYLRAATSAVRRQVALIELDPTPEGKVDGPITKFARTYVADLSTVEGGSYSMLHFHGPPEDEFKTNAKRIEGDLSEREKEFFEGYFLHDWRWKGMVEDENLVTTWRMSREQTVFTTPNRGERTAPGAEPRILGVHYDPESPRKYLRTHALGAKGKSFYTGRWYSAPFTGKAADYFQQVHLLHNRVEGEKWNAFPMVWEPYVGEPFIKSVQELAVKTPSSKALFPRAIAVRTVDGINDTIYFSNQPETRGERGLIEAEVEGRFTLKAQYAYLSQDEAGRVRQVSLVEGEAFTSARIAITPGRASWGGEVVEVDPVKRRLKLEGEVPQGLLEGAFFELSRPEGHVVSPLAKSAYEIVSLSAAEGEIFFRKGVDVFSGEIQEISYDQKKGHALLRMSFTPNQSLRAVSAQPGGKTVRAGASGNGVAIPLDEFDPEQFKVGTRLYAYAMGVGDRVRIPTKVSLRRVDADGVYQLEANTDCHLALKGEAQWSPDGKVWTQVSEVKGWSQLAFTLDKVKAPIFIRWKGGIE